MPRIDRTITSNALVQKVDAFIADPRNEPQWQANLMSIRDVTGEGAGQREGFALCVRYFSRPAHPC